MILPSHFFFFFLLLAPFLSFYSLGLPELEPNRDDLIMDQVLVGQKFGDVAPIIGKVIEKFYSMKLLFVKYWALMVNYEWESKCEIIT